MTKYYDDALQAAYMAREFGVKWSSVGDDTYMKIYMRLSRELNFTMSIHHDETKDFAIVHPDSYHIFEPQVGDLVIERGNIREHDRIGTVSRITKDKQLSAVADYHDDEDYKGTLVHMIFHKKAEIIQRDGKPFFTPMEKADD